MHWCLDVISYIGTLQLSDVVVGVLVKPFWPTYIACILLLIRFIQREIWLDELQTEPEGSDPTRFIVGLVPKGVNGDFHTRNRSGEHQRSVVSHFDGGMRNKPAFSVSCTAEVIIHGKMDPASLKYATLLVYELRFNSYRGNRIKEADLTFEFFNNEGNLGPTVLTTSPHGRYGLGETKDIETSKLTMGISAEHFVKCQITDEKTTKREKTYYQIVSGDNHPSDVFGNRTRSRFYMKENHSRLSGIPSELRVCILLERDNNECFICVPNFSVKPNFSAAIEATLFSERSKNDPVIFNPAIPPLNKLGAAVAIDPNNLGSVKLDSLWGCTTYTPYTQDKGEN